METKFYDHVISLGLNCEIAHQIRLNHGNVESNLLTWTHVNPCHLKQLLLDYTLAFSRTHTLHPNINMISCDITKCYWHVKCKDNEITYSEVKECIERVRYLAARDQAINKDTSSKLYVLGLHTWFLDTYKKEAADLIIEVQDVIFKIANNADILFIVERKLQSQLVNINDNTFIRYIDHFAPMNKAVYAGYHDDEGYKRIFTEFMPRSVSLNVKKVKYEKIPVSALDEFVSHSGIKCMPRLGTSYPEEQNMTELQTGLVAAARLRYSSMYPEKLWDLFPLETAILAMRESKEFDTDKYLTRYPDVKKSGIEAIEHFMRFGADENRDLPLKVHPVKDKLDAT